MSDKTASCLVCKETAELRYSEFPGYIEPDTFSIYHCSHCNTAFALPRNDTSSVYEMIYKNAELVPGYNRYILYAKFIKDLRDPLKFLAESSEAYWGVRKILNETERPAKPLTILEVGSGLGYLTYALAKAGYNAHGLDISETAVKEAKDRFGDFYICESIYDHAIKHPASCNMVISTEVVEHIDEPARFIDAVITLLKPGGKAIITTPNKSFYPGDIIWASDLPPVHLWWFSEDSLRYFARKSGAGISFIDYSPFYRRNFKAVGLRSQRNGKLPRPFFNKNGELLSGAAKSKSEIKIKLRVRVSDNRLLNPVFSFIKGSVKLIAGKLRKAFGKDVIVCSARGVLLCAVLQKEK